jgi:hypothetical protein
MKAKKSTDNQLVDARLNFFKNVRDVTFEKMKEVVHKMDLIDFCLKELKGCEKLYGLMYIFTELGDLEQPDIHLIRKTNILVIGDMMNMDTYFINSMCDMIVDNFYSFDRLKDGYLVNHNFVEMEKYIEMRINAAHERKN